MKLLVRVRPENGHFTASLHGDEQFRGEGPSRDSAISSLLEQLDKRGIDEIVEIEWPRRDILALSGSYQSIDAELLDDIIAEAYRERDAEKAAEFPK